MAPTPPADDTRPQRAIHQQRHRAMARHALPDVDCLADQIDAAQQLGDEYLAALLQRAAERLAR